jgi:hypothetical protein
MEAQHYDVVEAIMAYEQGSLDKDETVQLFQHLVDDGTIYHLQGSYQHAAEELYQAGLIEIPGVQHSVH